MSDTTALPQHELPGQGARCAVHPERAARVTCSRCGNFACEDCETRGDGGAVLCKACETAGDGTPIPWEQRSELGIPTAFLRTTIAILLRPWEFFAWRSRESSILPVVLYGWIVTAPSSLLGMLSNLLTLESQRTQLLANPFTREMVWVAEPPFQIAVGLVSVALYPLILGFYGVWWHLALLPFGATSRPFKETVRSLGYVHAVSIPMIVMLPFIAIMNLVGMQALGGVLALPFVIYSWAMAGIAMWKTHRCDGWKVFAAVGVQIAFVVVLSCVLAGLIVAVVFATLPVPLR